MSWGTFYWDTLYFTHAIHDLVNVYILGWGATDRTGEQSRYPRQVDLTLNTTTDCNCSSIYFLETNVGPKGEDTCEGDSGHVIHVFD